MRIAIALLLASVCVACGGSSDPSSTPPLSTPSLPSLPSPPPSPSPKASPVPAIRPVPPAAAVPGLDRVRSYTDLFYRGDLVGLYSHFSNELKKSFPMDKLVAFREQIADTYGKEVKVVGEDAQTKGEYRGFVRYARFDKHEGVVNIEWILRPDDTIAGFFVRSPAPPAKAPPAKQKAPR